MLTKELMARIRKIEIRTRRMVDELTAGAYHSVFKGSGIEFDEVREYTTDDDVRDIDWNVTARMGAPYVKKYVEERELTVMLAVDVSASGNFGGGAKTKQETAVEIASLLAFSASRNHDRVGLFLFSDRTELYLPPKTGSSHGLRLIREMLAREPEGTRTDISGALRTLTRSLKKKAVIFLISDFIDEKDFRKPLMVANKRHDVIAARVLDPLELELPPLMDMALSDAETGATGFFRGGKKAARKAYADFVAKAHARTRDICSRAKVDLIDIRRGDDLVKPLMMFFRQRERRFAKT